MNSLKVVEGFLNALTQSHSRKIVQHETWIVKVLVMTESVVGPDSLSVKKLAALI